MADRLALCTFLVDGRTFALPMADVQEVLRAVDATPVPLAGVVVRGLVNLRGQIATALDLRAALGLPPAGAAAGAGASVVVKAPDGLACLVVDEIGDVIEVPTHSLEKPPETLAPALRDLVRSLCKREHDLVLVLDTARAIDPTPSRDASPRRAEETP